MYILGKQNVYLYFQVIKKLMERDMPLVPRFHFDIADVRDVALAHLRAMKVAEATGMFDKMFHCYHFRNHVVCDF